MSETKVDAEINTSDFGSSVKKQYIWKGLEINYEIINQESDNLPIIFMPSVFMTTTRKVFRPAIEKMKSKHPIVLIEPPGFGENSDVKMDKSMMNPKTFIQFIEDFVKYTHKIDFN